MKYLKSYINAIKYIKDIATFKEENIHALKFSDETYEGLDGSETIVRIFKTNNINAPPNQTIIMSFTFTAKISPNNKPIKSNLIVAINPITTNPTAREEWASNPNNASVGKLVVFSNFSKIRATIDEIINTERAIFISMV